MMYRDCYDLGVNNLYCVYNTFADIFFNTYTYVYILDI